MLGEAAPLIDGDVARTVAAIISPAIIALAAAIGKIGHWAYKVADRYVTGMLEAQNNLNGELLKLIRDSGSAITNNNRSTMELTERLSDLQREYRDDQRDVREFMEQRGYTSRRKRAGDEN